MTILPRRPCACANGWRREDGCSSTMPKRQQWTLWRTWVADATQQSNKIARSMGKKHVSGARSRKQMVDRIRRDAVDAGRPRTRHSLHLGFVHQAAEPGFRLGPCEHFRRRRYRRDLVRDRYSLRG